MGVVSGIVFVITKVWHQNFSKFLLVYYTGAGALGQLSVVLRSPLIRRRLHVDSRDSFSWWCR